MKTKIFFTIIVTLSFSICKSQITQDYPFKTYVSGDSTLYVTGNELNPSTKSLDIMTAKYNGNSLIYKNYFPNIDGTDRGIDLAVDSAGNVVVTGYIYNNVTSSNDIILLKYNSGGTYLWHRIIENPGDDKGMGIDITLDENNLIVEIFIVGYITTPSNGQNFFTKKYLADGTPDWEHSYDATGFDDIATDIKVKGSYAYVIGYSYQGPQYLDDITFLTYWKENGDLKDDVTHHIAGRNERPTEFSLADAYNNQAIAKSRSTVGGISDGHTLGHPDSEYITIFYEPDADTNVVVKWSKTFCNNRLLSSQNILTAVTADTSGNVLVTGYTFNGENYMQSNGLDFTTIKYGKREGDRLWVKFYDKDPNSTTGVDDKASSIKVNDSDHVYIAGMSEASPNGYSIVKYKQTLNQALLNRENVYYPNFLATLSPPRLMNKHAKIELTNDGTPLLVVMAWDENTAYWSAIKYDANLNVEYIINPNETDELARRGDNLNAESPYKFKLEQNYPNPFNPKTIINYELRITSYVKLIVFNSLGKEVATLVNERQNAGHHNYQFSIDNYQLSSGVYFYKLIADGAVIDTKRMMIVK